PHSRHFADCPCADADRRGRDQHDRSRRRADHPLARSRPDDLPAGPKTLGRILAKRASRPRYAPDVLAGLGGLWRPGRCAWLCCPRARMMRPIIDIAARVSLAMIAALSQL